jgi:opacity protein-like surface antigen
MKKIAVALFLFATAPAWAQYGELWFSAGQSLISNGGIGTLETIGGSEDDVKLTDGFRFGFRFSINQDGRTGYEIQYAYSRMQLRYSDVSGAVIEQGMASHTGGVNYLLYAMPLENRIRPFATGGVHFQNYVPPGASAASGQGSTKFGFNYGGGVKIRATDMFILRFDIRQYTNPKPDFGLPLRSGWIRQNEVSGGFGIYF